VSLDFAPAAALPLPAAAYDPSGDAASVSSLPAVQPRLCGPPAGRTVSHPGWLPRAEWGAGSGSVPPAVPPPLPLEMGLDNLDADDLEALDAALAALNDAPSPFLPQLASCPDWL
jgi:hypothetical protein